MQQWGSFHPTKAAATDTKPMDVYAWLSFDIIIIIISFYFFDKQQVVCHSCQNNYMEMAFAGQHQIDSNWTDGYKCLAFPPTPAASPTPDLSVRVHAPRARSFHTWHKSVRCKKEMSFSDLLCFIAVLLGFLFSFRSDKTLIIIALMHKMS